MDVRGARPAAHAAEPVPAQVSAPVPTAGSAPVAAAGRRAYDATGRRASAEVRRGEVVAVAARLFASLGWRGTTVAGVAREAGVSPAYVTKTFGAKPDLLMAAVRSRSFTRGLPLPQALAALRLEDEPDVDVRLDRFVDFALAAVAPMAPLVPVMTQGGAEDPTMSAVLAAARAGHVEAIRALVAMVTTSPPPDAVEALVLLTRAETYLLMVGEIGWTEERFRGWLRRSVGQALAG